MPNNTFNAETVFSRNVSGKDVHKTVFKLNLISIIKQNRIYSLSGRTIVYDNITIPNVVLENLQNQNILSQNLYH